MDITLKFPVTVKGEEIKSLTFRRPKNRDLEALEIRKGGDTKRTVALLADLAGVDPDVISELDLEDTAQINDWLEPLLDPKGERSKKDGD